MDSKKNLKEVEAALQTLYQKIDSLKEKVDKLCETTGNFDAGLPKKPKKDEM